MSVDVLKTKFIYTDIFQVKKRKIKSKRLFDMDEIKPHVNLLKVE